MKHSYAHILSRPAAIVLAAVLCACTIAPSAATPTPLPEPPSPSAPVFTAQRGLVVRQIQFTGRVQPLQTTPLQFEIDGRVRKLNVRSGDLVKQGDVLAEIDLTDIRAQLQQAEIQLRVAQLGLTDTLSSYTRTVRLAELDVDQAELKYAIAKERINPANADTLRNDLARNAQTIADIETSIAQARAKFNQAGADNAEKQLTQAKIDREKIEARLSEADADLRAREIELGLLRSELERTRLALDAKKNGGDSTKAQAVESARLTVEVLRARELRGSLIAPFDGSVVVQPLAVGDQVKALDDTMVVARVGAVEVVALVSDSQLRDLSAGQPISVSLAGLPNQIVQGVIRRVPVNDRNEKDKYVRIALDPAIAARALETGMLARCNAELGRREGVVWLPPQAVRNFRGRQFVIVLDPGGRQRRVDVILGLESLERVEIVDGLSGGESVLGQN